MKELGIGTGTAEVSFTNRIQETEDRISSVEDTKEKDGYISQRKCQIQKTTDTKHPGNLKHNKSVKPQNSGYGGRRGSLVQRPRSSTKS